MKSKVFLICVMIFCCLSLASAHWFDPFHIFHNEEETDGHQFNIITSEGQWDIIDSTGDFETYIENKTDKKTFIGWYIKDGINVGDVDTSDRLIYDCEGSTLLDDKDKNITLKYETNKIPNPNEPDGMSDGYSIALTDASAINVGDCIKINPTVMYQNISMINFVEGNLTVNNTLKKWNGEEFVISPEEIWIREISNDFKFGANDTVAKQNTNYQYEWYSNKEIKYDSKKDYYYFEEYLVETNEISNIYTRRDLDVSDICDSYCINSSGEGENKTCQETFNPNCEFSLKNTTLLINFTGYYNSTLNMIFIDPSYSYTNVSTAITDSENIRSEPGFSHLSTDVNDSLVLYYSFDVNGSTEYDYSSNDNDATVTGSTFNTTDCVYGNCYSFDGSDDIIVTDSNLDVVEKITVAGWLKVDTVTGGYQRLAETRFNTGFYLGLGPDTTIMTTRPIAFIIKGIILQPTIDSTNLSQWHHYAGTWNGTVMRAFFDGVYIGTTSTSAGNMTANDMALGRDQVASAPNTDGNFDELIIFDRVLTYGNVAVDQMAGGEMGELYNSTFQKFYNQGTQNFSSNNYTTLGDDNRANITIKAEAFNDSSFGLKLWESVDNSTWTLSSSGEVAFETFNTTHLQASEIVLTGGSSTWLFPEIIYNSTNGFYSGILEDVRIDTYEFVPTDTCTYTSGNWEVDCADDCTISSPVDLGGNNISIIGAGTFTVTANISNFVQKFERGDDSSNICTIGCFGGGCFI